MDLQEDSQTLLINCQLTFRNKAREVELGGQKKYIYKGIAFDEVRASDFGL